MFLILLMEIALIFALVVVMMAISIVAKSKDWYNTSVYMLGDLRHNGWFLIIVLSLVIWTVVGWNSPVSPLAYISVSDNIDAVAGVDRPELVRRADHVSGIFQLGSLYNWLAPVASAEVVNTDGGWLPQPNQTLGYAKFVGWLILLLSLFWIWSDDLIGLVASWIQAMRSHTVSATTTTGQAPASTQSPTGTNPPNTTGGQMARKDWQRWFSPRWLVEYLSDDVAGEIIADLLGKKITGLFHR